MPAFPSIWDKHLRREAGHQMTVLLLCVDIRSHSSLPKKQHFFHLSVPTIRGPLSRMLKTTRISRFRIVWIPSVQLWTTKRTTWRRNNVFGLMFSDVSDYSSRHGGKAVCVLMTRMQRKGDLRKRPGQDAATKDTPPVTLPHTRPSLPFTTSQ